MATQSAPLVPSTYAGRAARGVRAAVGGSLAAGRTPRALVVALALFLVVNFARAHEGFYFLLPLHLAQVTGIPLILLALAKLPREQLRAVLSTRPGRCVLFIGAMMVLSVPLSIWPGHSVAYLRSTAPISYMMFVTTAAVLVDRQAIPLVLRAEVLAAASGAIRMQLPGAPVYMEGGIPRALFGWTYDPNDTAVLFLVTIPLAIYLATRRGAARWLWYGVALIMVLAIVRTGSRGGMLGMGAMLGALVLLSPARQRARLMTAGAAAAVVFVGAVQANPVLRARFASTFETDYNQTATNGRIEIWKRGMYYMATHPATGVGIDNFTVAELRIGSGLKQQQGITDRHMFTAHNSLVQIGAELGVPGLLAFLGMVATAAAGLWRIRSRASASGEAAADDAALASSVLTSITGLFAGGFFLSLAYSPMTYFTYALAAAVIARGVRAIDNNQTGAVVVTRPTGRRGGLWRPQLIAGSSAQRPLW